MIDIKEKDLFLENKSNSSIPAFDVVWGNIFDADDTADVLICNIIIPEAYWNTIKYENRQLLIKFKTPYMPDTNTFRIRLVKFQNAKYSLFWNIRGEFGLPVNSFALSQNISAPISACMLPFVDIDGEFIVKMVQNEQVEELDKAYIYSSKETDIRIDYSDDQSAQLLSICNPGNSYRYPTTGVGITQYINSVISHTDFAEKLEAQFESDGKRIVEADFDNTNCNLDVLFIHETETKDTNLIPINELAIDFFSMFDDDYVRRSIVLNEVDDLDFINLLNEYTNFIEIMFFPDHSTTKTRIADNVIPGKFDENGNIVESDEYFIVKATLDANTIIMFDNPEDDNVKDVPVFAINDIDESRLYTSLIEQPYWITETCHKCFILLKRSIVCYMIKQDAFKNEKGLYIIPQTSSNVKNMIAMAQDTHTGRLLGIVSNSTNISDITLEEITQYIYASKEND